MDTLKPRFYEEQNYKTTDSLLNQEEISLTVNHETSSIPTTLNNLGQPSDFMEVDFHHPAFQKLYAEADEKYAVEMNKLDRIDPTQALVLRLQIRDQTFQKHFPSDGKTMNRYESVHIQLHDENEIVQLSDYFKAGSAVCIQRASLTAYYLAQHTAIPSELKIQKLPTTDGEQEYHAYIKIGNYYYDPTNPLRIQQPDGKIYIQPNITQKAEELLIPGTRSIGNQTTLALGDALKNAGENYSSFAA